MTPTTPVVMSAPVAHASLVSAPVQVFLHSADASVFQTIAPGIPAALVALVIGAAAAFIAWNQYRVAHAKLSLDLFDKRFAIFEQTWKILSITSQRGTRESSFGLATPFNNFLPQARFLFGNEVSAYLDTASSNWSELFGLEGEDMAADDRLKNIHRRTELRAWFFEEASRGCKRVFDPYLSFEEWKPSRKNVRD